MKIYNVSGWLLVLAYALACMYFAPTDLGPWLGLLIGAAYFVVCWLVGGVYLSCVIHMGIAHRALDYKEWFVKAITIANNTFGVYVNPVSWVNRHRLHHKYSDHAGDPNKLAADGFWRTLYLCLMPYQAAEDMAGDAIFRSRTFRLVSHPVFCVGAQVFNFCLLWLLVRDLRFAAAIWVGLYAVTRISSVGSLAATTAFMPILWLRGEPLAFVALAAAMWLVILWRHRANIRRLLRREEGKV